MAFSSAISSEGQIRVPLEIRKRLGLKTGDRVEFVVEYNRTIIRRAREPENPFLKYVGALSAFSSTRDLAEWLHMLRDDEEADEETETRHPAIAAKKDEHIDLSDAPPVLDWSVAEIGKFYRLTKKPVTKRRES